MIINKKELVKETREKFTGEGEVIAPLMDFQRKEGFLSCEVLKKIAEVKKIPLAHSTELSLFIRSFLFILEVSTLSMFARGLLAMFKVFLK